MNMMGWEGRLSASSPSTCFRGGLLPRYRDWDSSFVECVGDFFLYTGELRSAGQPLAGKNV
jgi:hypothetical protein